MATVSKQLIELLKNTDAEAPEYKVIGSAIEQIHDYSNALVDCAKMLESVHKNTGSLSAQAQAEKVKQLLKKDG